MGEVWKARDTRLVAARTPLRARSGFPVFQLPAGTPGFGLEEVAAATGSSVGSVKQKAHRAYEKLRRVLGKQL